MTRPHRKIAPLAMIVAVTSLLLSGGGRESIAATAGSKVVGPAYIDLSTPSAKFGEYTGIRDSGLYLIGELDLAWQKDSHYVTALATNLGLDNRGIDINAGRYTNYFLTISYQQIPHLTSMNAKTPFNGVGSNRLTLPADFTRASKTSGMISLPAGLHDVTLETERRNSELKFSKILTDTWQFNTVFRHEQKEGVQATGGTIGQHGGFTDSVLLPSHIDYLQNEIQLGFAYTTTKRQFEINYFLSQFTNQDDAITWDNPFLKAAPPAINYPLTARTSTPPDNTQQRLQVTGGINLFEQTRLSMVAEVSKFEQNESLLDYTINPNIAIPTALPRQTTAAETQIQHLTVNLSSTPLPRLWLGAKYRYYRTDNQMPAELFLRVINDTTPQAEENEHHASYSLPYDYEQNYFALDSRYHFNQSWTLNLGASRDTTNRTYRAVRQTTEEVFSAKLAKRWNDRLETALYGKTLQREGSDYDAASVFTTRQTSSYIATLPPENQFQQHPLVRQGDIADRDRLTYGGTALFHFNDITDVSASFDRSDDDYPDSQLGITAGSSVAYTFDVNVAASKSTAVFIYYTREEFETEQTVRSFTGINQAAQSQDANRNWNAIHSDDINTVGLGSKVKPFSERFTLNIEMTYAQAKNRVAFAAGSVLDKPAVTGDEPRDLVDENSRRYALNLKGDYELSALLGIGLGLVYETLDFSDWQYQGVEAGSNVVDDVLPITGMEPDYAAYTVYTTLRYRL